MVLYVLWNLQTSAGRAVVRLCETEFGISRRQWRLLALLAEHPDMQPSALALRSGLDRARTSRALSELVQKKLVQRIPRPGNRREVTLRLTEQGSALQARLRPRVADINGRLLAGLRPAEGGQVGDKVGRAPGEGEGGGGPAEPTGGGWGAGHSGGQAGGRPRSRGRGGAGGAAMAIDLSGCWAT